MHFLRNKRNKASVNAIYHFHRVYAVFYNLKIESVEMMEWVLIKMFWDFVDIVEETGRFVRRNPEVYNVWIKELQELDDEIRAKRKKRKKRTKRPNIERYGGRTKENG